MTKGSMSNEEADRFLMNQHLNTLEKSREFRRSARLVRFLRYIVEQAAEGRVEALRERAIGESVFDQSPEFDPKINPIVRTEARRLRQKLDKYYQEEGRSERLRLVLEKGSYCPRFERHEAEESSTGFTHKKYSAGLVWKKRLFSAIFALLLIVIVLLGLKSRHSGHDIAVETNPLANEYGLEFHPAVSPDGSRVAYVWDGNQNHFQIYLRDIKGGRIQRFTNSAGADYHPSWSPDGQYVAFLRVENKKAYVIYRAVNGAMEKTIAPLSFLQAGWTGDVSSDEGNRGPVWLPDGKTVVLSDRDENGVAFPLYRFDTATGKRRAITSPGGTECDLYPTISPDGRSLAFVRYFSHAQGEVFISNSDGSGVRQVTSLRHVISGITWTSDGKSLVFASNHTGEYRLWEIAATGGNMRTLPTVGASPSDPVVVPGSQTLLYTASAQNWNIWQMPLVHDKAVMPVRLISSSGRNHSPRYSPDGSRIAFVSDRSGHWEIWLCNQNGGDPIQLTHIGGSWVGGLSWSPDGRQIAFDARPKGHSAIFLISSNGGLPRQLEENPFEDRMPFWSHDGQWIYFNSSRSGKIGIWKKPVGGGGAIKVLDEGFRGREDWGRSRIYYDLPNASGIRSSDLAGQHSVLLKATAMSSPHLNWDLTSGGIVFVNRDMHGGGLWFCSYAAETARQIGIVGEDLVDDIPGLTISPDGKYILYTQRDYTSSDILQLRGALQASN